MVCAVVANQFELGDQLKVTRRPAARLTAINWSIIRHSTSGKS
jgi:hypothetical protein